MAAVPTQRRRRPELAAFLRSRRARVTPEDVGMPPGLRRRTPGLRREEVAHLSGVGVTWYTWLEQGRPINASAQVLDAVARTLRLDRPEREHLYHLAEVPYAPERSAGDVQEVSPEIQGILDALEPHPAVLYNARYDVLATNTVYERLFFQDGQTPDTGPFSIRNALWALFGVPGPLCPVVDRKRESALMVARLRGAYGRHAGEPAWEELVRGLAEVSPEFTRLWRGGDVVPPGTRVKVLRHARVGEVRLTSVSLSVNGMPECRIVAYTPTDEESRRGLASLREVPDPREVADPREVPERRIPPPAGDGIR
ncbi:helix-turn-helix transcriptional regulator [Streptomyces sp. SR27]|uniref:helix-turn-helix transcriptional regulator n=1 Tax=unclassified Streptomyces TaxID=2593676 RepID=UPI00295B8037|nr:helix-turn-helix transcriptional regulator [Streptomyces sp. SR27]MDV9190690.1 helix-turn-helix transcriptional regulator [Streptomyces sp. SR27]